MVVVSYMPSGKRQSCHKCSDPSKEGFLSSVVRNRRLSTFSCQMITIMLSLLDSASTSKWLHDVTQCFAELAESVHDWTVACCLIKFKVYKHTHQIKQIKKTFRRLVKFSVYHSCWSSPCAYCHHCWWKVQRYFLNCTYVLIFYNRPL